MVDSGTAHLEMSLENPNLRTYIFNSIKPYIKENILEVGCGLGAYTDMLEECGIVLPIDNNPLYVKEVEGAEEQDIAGAWPTKMLKRFDTIVAINVLEHIKNEKAAVLQMRDSLKKDGRIILVLPAYHWLYGHVDKKIGHFRRYRKKDIDFSSFALVTEKIFFINSLGIFGWWFTKIRKTNIVNQKLLSLYDKFIPLVKLIDWLFDYSWGLNMIVILKVK